MVKYKTYRMSTIEIPFGFYNKADIKDFVNLLENRDKKLNKILKEQVNNAIPNK